jgi:hypothetical protein
MPIKTSGPISLQDIVDEFGGVKPYSIADYYRGGSYVPNKNVNSNIAAVGSGDPIAFDDFYGASKIITLSFTAYGGGGAGGSGYENGGLNSGSFAGAGKITGIMLKSTYDSLASTPAPADFLAATTGGSSSKALASGGSGGENGGHKLGEPGLTGGGTDFGAGGNGGSLNNAAPQPVWGRWGVGGGGGGGDGGKGDDYFIIIPEGGGDDAGAGGDGGLAGVKTTGTIDIDVEVEYVVVIGGGGASSSAGNHRGGRGMPGYLEFTVDTDTGTFTFKPPEITAPAALDYTGNRFFGFRITRGGQVDTFSV